MLRRALAGLALTAAAALPLAGAQAQGYSAEQELVDRAAITLRQLANDPQMRNIPTYLRQAEAVLIVPDLVKGGFIFGAEGGNGVLLLRQSPTVWSYPAFYTVGAGSVGLQIGIEMKEVMFLIMNPGAVESVLDDQAKLGVDLSGAIGPIGVGFEASTTTNLDQDIIAFSRGSGLFAGGALEGAVIARRGDMNEDFYGLGADARSITQQNLFANPGADALRTLLGIFGQ